MNDRNQPCKCGSGKKTKKCCDTAEKHNAAMAEAKAKMLAQIASGRRRMRRMQRLVVPPALTKRGNSSPRSLRLLNRFGR